MRSVGSRTVVVIAALGLGLAGGVWAQTPWLVPESEQDKKSPIAASPKVVEHGQKVAQVNCVSCHGKAGKGDGVAAVALNPKPADWTSKRVQDETDGELFWRITTGRGAMPGWRHLSENDRWVLVQYVRSFKK